MEHTPTPWRTTPTFSHVFVDEDGHGGVICKMASNNDALQWVCDAASLENSANAKFIIQACNSHDELLATCKETLELLYGLSNGCHTKQRAEEYVTEVLALKRAIAKAEGRG